jgi:putative ABC transport system permease protein
MSRVERGLGLYRFLLRALPPGFRKAHEDEMVAWVRTARAADSGAARWPRLWSVVLIDLIRTVIVEWWLAIVGVVRASRHTGGMLTMDGLRQDLRTAISSFTKRPAWLVLALGTIGMGVGAATTVYSVAHGVLLAPLPYEDPDRLVRVGKISDGRAGVLSVSALDLGDLQDRNRSFSALAASRPASMTLAGQGEPELLRVAMVSAEFFDALGRQPVHGRAWSPDGDLPGADPVVVLSDGLWHRRWGGDPGILGRSVSLNGTAFTVIGVMAADFAPPEALGQRGAVAWVPLAFVDAQARARRSDGFLQLIGRLRPNATRSSAADDLTRLGREISGDFPGPGERTFGLSPLHEETVQDAGTSMTPLVVAVGFLLAIACTNVANLLLMLSAERSREMVLRGCLGAGRGRLIRQLMTENLLLGLGGGALGSLLGAVGVTAFAELAPAQLPRLTEVTVSGRVLVVAALVSAVTTVAFGVLPAFRGAGSGVTERVPTGGRGAVGSAPGEMGTRGLLVVAESAMAIVLVVCGGLLFNSLLRLNAVDPGFEAEGVGVISLLYREPESAGELTGFLDQLLDRVAAMPGVRAAGATVNLPLSGANQMLRLRGPGVRLEADEEELGGYPIDYQQVTTGYFAAMGIQLLSGREFSRGDDAGAQRVAIVNESLARRLRGDADVLGTSLVLSGDPEGARPVRVVGVVEDTRQRSLDEAGAPQLYLPFEQLPSRRVDVVARAAGSGAVLLPAMREQLWALRPDLPVRRSVDMTGFMADSLADRHFLAILVGGFASVALALTVVGVYGTLAFSVTQRRHEIGVRVALGATSASVLRAVLGQSARWVATGALVGVGASLFVTRLLASLLYDVAPTDPLTITVAVPLVCGTAAVASVFPALRAADVDPMINIRTE